MCFQQTSSQTDKDVSMPPLKESLSIAQCGPFKIELSGINERILPPRPSPPPPLFVQLNVFAAPPPSPIRPSRGACQDLLVEQVIPRHLPSAAEGKSTLSAHPCVLKSSAERGRERELRLVCVRGSLMLITALRNDASRPGKRLKTDPIKQRGRKEACQLNATFFSVSVTIHLAPANGIKVYPKRRVCIKDERFRLLLCI